MSELVSDLKTSSWKPYVIGFLIGAVILTILPFMQKAFLKAPPPVRALAAWSLSSLAGGDVSSSALRGKVLLVTLESAACDAPCVERQKSFGTATHHVDDLHEAVVLLTLTSDAARPGLEPLIGAATPAWRFATPDEAMLTELQTGLEQFLGANTTDYRRSHAIVLIDQNNALRGFWPNDGAGRGNSINAARLLAKSGPNP
jgi:cytochrome oxidase Cu insertion factor (SCO1/SenC/PrrC family)